MSDDILLQRASIYLRERIQEALRLSVDDLCKMLRITKCANTAHATDCQRYAEALIFDYIRERGRPTYSPDARECPKLDDIACMIARKAAYKAMREIERLSESENEQ